MASPVRDMVIFISLLYGMKNIDQTDPIIINYCRVVFAVYVFVGMTMQAYILRQITKKNDLREIEVPPQPSFGAPAGPPEKKTVMDYDMGHLSQQRNQILLNGVIIAFMHFKMGQVSPLVMTSVMGILRFVDDAMFKIHVMGAAEEGPLERPFKTEPNPLMGWLMGQVNPDANAATENEGDEGDEDEGEESSGSESEEEATTSTSTSKKDAAAAAEPKKTK